MVFHRIEFTDFTTAELYILSVALVLAFRRTGVTRYTALWCPDFPPRITPERQTGLLGQR
ncbi:hypothetical protein SAMN04490243_2205 [Robiginitalea myxolifaciens]|uniref:Uncharacterized protein n=1 Tax=Robiginitalea myxolifaciens TaxID=400055 RepID=A0A1I6H3Q1_9FLAO|nr:hypothetical protein SAMN04490243_2205 [Robiginitalea myxolifaciens]